MNIKVELTDDNGKVTHVWERCNMGPFQSRITWNVIYAVTHDE